MKNQRNYLYAILVFGLTFLTMNGAALLLSSGMYTLGGLVGGRDGIYKISKYLQDHYDWFSASVYLIVLVLFGIWYYFAVVEKEGIRKFVSRNVRKISPVSVVWVFLLAFGIVHATSVVFSIFAVISPETLEKYSEMMSAVEDSSVFWWIAGTLVLPPITEEIIFRGLILGYLRKAGMTFLLADLVQAVLFGIYHQNLIQGIYAAVLGLILGWLAKRYESIFVPVFLHFLYNMFGTALTELESRFLPQTLQGVIILQSIPLVIFAVLMIHFRVGEKSSGRKAG